MTAALSAPSALSRYQRRIQDTKPRRRPASANPSCAAGTSTPSPTLAFMQREPSAFKQPSSNSFARARAVHLALREVEFYSIQSRSPSTCSWRSQQRTVPKPPSNAPTRERFIRASGARRATPPVGCQRSTGEVMAQRETHAPVPTAASSAFAGPWHPRSPDVKRLCDELVEEGAWLRAQMEALKSYMLP